MEDFILVFENLFSFLIFSLWWVYTPVLLFLILIMVFQIYTKTKYFFSLKWTLLEIRVPQIKRGPKAMDNVLSALHGILDPPRPRDRFWKGKVQNWFSFEIVGVKGETRVFIRTVEGFKNLVESQFYAQYPDCEIREVLEDHVNALPPIFNAAEYDIFGVEFILTKEDAYPIKTYVQFEELNPGREEESKRIDPMASIAETLSRLNAGEYMGMQVLARPATDKWVKDGQAVIDKLLGKEPKVQESFLLKTVNYIDKLIPGGAAPKEEKKEEKRRESTPGQNEVLKAVEASLGKLGYEAGIRFVYAAPKDSFQRSHIASINAAMKQFNTHNLNGFKWNMAVTTLIAKQPFKKRKILNKKRMMLRNYKLRQFVQKPIILTTEELATVFHFPDIGVRSATLPRIEAKKGQPPQELPIG